jgi:hypothetical protein
MAIKEEFEDTKGEAESVHRRRTDNTMAKRKRTIEKKTAIYKALHRKRQIEQHVPQ